MISRAFTLLEVVIALVLLSLAASAIGVRISKAIDERRYQASVDRLHQELDACHKMALQMQADWNVILEVDQGKFKLLRTCPELGRSTLLVWDTPCQCIWGDEIVRSLAIQFSASGAILPKGVLELCWNKQKTAWELPQLFHCTEETNGKLQRPD